MTMITDDLLNCSLAIAIPLAAIEYQEDFDKWESDREKIMSYAEVFSHQGDELLFRQKGVSGPLFVKLARALAWLAFVPGGVNFNGVLYQKYFQCNLKTK